MLFALFLSLADVSIAQGRQSDKYAQSLWDIPSDIAPPQTGVKGENPQFESPSGLLFVTLQQYKEKCLPLPDNLSEVTSGNAYREGTYSAAAGIIKSAPNPCEASVELKLFLEGQKGEWTLGHFAGESKDMGLRVVFSALIQKYLIGMAVNPTLTIGIKLSSLVEEELKKRSSAAPIQAANEIFKKTRGMSRDGVDRTEADLKSKISSHEKNLDNLTVKYGQKLEGYRPKHPYNRLNPSTAWQIFFDKELEFAKQEAVERADILYEISSLEFQRGVLNQHRRPLLEKTCDEVIESLSRDCANAKKSDAASKPPEPPAGSPPAKPQGKDFSLLTDKDKSGLYNDLCRCACNPTVGGGSKYDPARGCVCSGVLGGEWRVPMVSSGECFDRAASAAGVDANKLGEQIYKDNYELYKKFIDEARSIIEEYLRPNPDKFQKKSEQSGIRSIGGYIQLAANISDNASIAQLLYARSPEGSVPMTYVGMVKEKNRRGDPDKALGLVRMAETFMPDRKASGETMNILAEFAIIMAKTSLNIVTDLEFDDGLYLLRKAADFYAAGKSSPLGETIQRLIGNFEKWREDWRIMKSEIPACMALIRDRRVCECDRINSEKITPASNSLTIYEFASADKWTVGTAVGSPRSIPEKNRILDPFKDALSRAKMQCAGNPAMSSMEMGKLTDYETRRFIEKSPYINQEDLKKSSASVICDTRAVKYAEKLLSSPGLCDCQQEKIKGILDTAMKYADPLSIEFSAEPEEVTVGGRVRLNMSIKGGKPPFSADMTGDYPYTQQSEARGFTIDYQARNIGANAFFVTVVDSCGDSDSKKVYLNVKAGKEKKADKKPESAQPTAGTSKPPEIAVYDPTKDANAGSSGSRKIDTAMVDQLGNDYRDGVKGGRRSDPKVDSKQAPVIQPESYSSSPGKPGGYSADGLSYDPYISDGSRNAGKDWQKWVKNKDGGYKDGGYKDGGYKDGGGSNQTKADCNPAEKQAAYKEGYTCGQKAKQNSNRMTSACLTMSQDYMNQDNKMKWGSCLYSGFDEGYRAGAGKTSGQASDGVMAELENRSTDNVHIFAEGQDNFGPQNKLAPNGKKTVSIKVPGGGGFVKFIAGRNGQKLAECRWEYTPASAGRVAVVKFSDPDRLACSTGMR